MKLTAEHGSGKLYDPMDRIAWPASLGLAGRSPSPHSMTRASMSICTMALRWVAKSLRLLVRALNIRCSTFSQTLIVRLPFRPALAPRAGNSPRSGVSQIPAAIYVRMKSRSMTAGYAYPMAIISRSSTPS